MSKKTKTIKAWVIVATILLLHLGFLGILALFSLDEIDCGIAYYFDEEHGNDFCGYDRDCAADWAKEYLVSKRVCVFLINLSL